jgi:hypothetical protein
VGLIFCGEIIYKEGSFCICDKINEYSDGSLIILSEIFCSFLEIIGNTIEK